MAEIEETQLPGVGIRRDFQTHYGRRLGVITHRSGDRELLVYDRDDPDACRSSVRLDEQDLHIVAELLGSTSVKQRLETVQHSVEGLTIDWVALSDSSAAVGQTIGRTELRQRTGVSIVAIVRDGVTLPAPGPEARLESGDTAVVVGTPQGIARAFDVLQTST